MLDQMTPPEKTKFWIGVGLWATGCIIGLLSQLFFNFIAPAAAGQWRIVGAVFKGAMVALPACAIYMIVPALVDRFEPEPWWMLAMAFIWGSFAGGGFAAVINTFAADLGMSLWGKLGRQIVGASISAPIVEESFKAMAPLGVFLFARRQFDGKVDGFIYASFSGLGFAVSENIVYYARGFLTDSFWFQFIFRGVLRPWNHAFYCALFGVGLGIARETTSETTKWLAPIGGLFAAIFLHSFWNSHGLLLALMGISSSFVTILVMTSFYILLVLALGAMIIYFVVKEGKTMREMLTDEVLIGNLTQGEVDLAVHPFARWKARLGPGGALAKDFVLAVTRLAMTKSHAARAYRGQKYTVSMDAVAPLRQEVARLRQQLYAGPWRQQY